MTTMLTPGSLSRAVTGAPGSAGGAGGAGGSAGAAGLGEATTATPAPPSTERLNWLRAGVLGANDGVVSVAAVVVGVAGASGSTHAIVMAGFAALIGGALSMALGEYVSVSSARDSQRASAAEVADHEIANPWHAGLASAIAFVAGAILPFLTVLLMPGAWRVPMTVVATLVALGLTGGIGARLGEAPVRRAVLRVLVGGSLALALTFGIGALFGVAVG